MAQRHNDYLVGYGKPPLHTRFRPGQSGNPAGRPRGAKDLATLVKKALDRRVAAAETGRRRRPSKREAVIERLVDRALDADLRATKMLFDLLLALDRREPPAAPAAAEEPMEDPRLTLLRRLQQFAEAAPTDDALARYLRTIEAPDDA